MSSITTSGSGADSTVPVGLLRRAAAFGLDYLVIATYLVIAVGAGAILRLALPDAAEVLFGGPLRAQLSGFLLLTLPISLYFILNEAGPRSATWGKRRLAVRVVAPHGGQIGLGRSAVRTALKFLPWELSHALIWQFSFAGSEPPATLTIGLVVVWAIIGANLLSVGVDRERRALYDRLAGTRVVRRAGTPSAPETGTRPSAHG